MKLLVTGGAGFIGSHLCEALLEIGHQVTAVDNLITGSRANIQHLVSNPAFSFLEHDVTNPLVPDQWQVIFHLASPASPVGYTRYPIETMLVNSLGTYCLLELAQNCGARFILGSTSEAYGDPLEHPQAETYWGNVNPVGPRACYDEGKRFAEALTINYWRKYGVDVYIVRIFNTYGPRNDPEDGRIMPNFITQALRGEPITVYGDGRQTRSLCYVSDLVAGILEAAFLENTKGEIINLGNPEEHTVLEYAEMIKRLTGSTSPIVMVESRPEEIKQRCPDISKARRLLGWEPKVRLEEGLQETIAWFRSVLPNTRQ